MDDYDLGFRDGASAAKNKAAKRLAEEFGIEMPKGGTPTERFEYALDLVCQMFEQGSDFQLERQSHEFPPQKDRFGGYDLLE